KPFGAEVGDPPERGGRTRARIGPVIAPQALERRVVQRLRLDELEIAVENILHQPRFFRGDALIGCLADFRCRCHALPPFRPPVGRRAASNRSDGGGASRSVAAPPHTGWATPSRTSRPANERGART